MSLTYTRGVTVNMGDYQSVRIEHGNNDIEYDELDAAKLEVDKRVARDILTMKTPVALTPGNAGFRTAQRELLSQFGLAHVIPA